MTDRPRQPLWFTVGVGLLLATSLGACSLLAGAGPTATPSPQAPPSEAGFPGPGGVFGWMEPLVAPSRMVVGYIKANGDVPTSRHEFAAGDAVRFTTGLSTGSYRLSVDGRPCLGTFEVRLIQETDLLLTNDRAGCATTVVGIHTGEGTHERAMLSGHVIPARQRAVVRLRSLDQPPVPPPPNVLTDEGGLFIFDLVTPGRYRVEVVIADAISGSSEVRLAAGDDRTIDITLDGGSIPGG